MNMDIVEDAFEENDTHNFAGHKLLLDVDADLDSNDVENIKFFCLGIIGMSKLEKIERGLEVFEELERLTKIKPDKHDFEFLVEILCRIHRFDLVRKLGEVGNGLNCKNAKRKYKDGDFTRTQLTPLRILLYNIAEDMEEKEFQEVVFLLGKRFGKANLKKMKNMLEVFTYLEREQELEAEDVEILKYILQNLQVKRTDLLDKVKEYEKYPWKRGRRIQDVEMPLVENYNNQNAQTVHQAVPVPVRQGPEHLTGSKIIHISSEVSKRPDWMKLIPALGLTQEEFEASVNGITTPYGQICKMLTYWKDVKQEDSKQCGQILYMALQSVGFDTIANMLADEEYLPGVAVYPIEYDREQSDLNQQVTHPPPEVPESQVIRAQLQQVGASEPAVQQPPPQGAQNTGPQRGEEAGQPRLEESISRGMPDIANAAVTGVHRGMTGTQGPPVGRNQQQANANEGRIMGSGEAAPSTPALPVNDETGIVQAARRINIDESGLPCYKMDVTPRGYAVIINNNQFFQDRDDQESKEMPNRTGTERDAGRLKYIFQKLDFIVESYDDLQDYEMCQKMSECAARSHRNFDCFVCCILSHGAAGHVYGVNGKLVRIDVLTSFFRSQICPTLAGKPKLFFIQACQGRQKQQGYDIEQDTAPELKKPDLVEDLQRELIPDEADFLLGYATVPGYVSYRSRSQGSWYVNKLVEMLDKYASREDLMSIMVKVNEEVGRANANIDGGRYKQIPAPLVTLRKKLYFR